MALSRRNFLRHLGVGTVAGAASRGSFSGIAKAVVLEPSRTTEFSAPILLNSNENAYGPSKRVEEAMRSALPRANRYPFREYDRLVQRIASFHRVKPEQVILGSGSTEILRIAAFTFLGVGRQLVQASPTFEAMEACARCSKAEILSVPLSREYAHDLEGMLKCGNASTLYYVCNPNNPTGSLTPRKDLETFIDKLPKASHVLIDEAYHHYAGESDYKSFIEHPIDHDRVIVSRTFSKVYGLAGLRLGYAIAHPTIAQKMRSHPTMATINEVAIQAAIAALEDIDSMVDSVKRNADDRQEFCNHARARGLMPIDSHANFVMLNVRHPAKEVIQYFEENNILVGRRVPQCDNYIRVSLGLPEEMNAFWRTWDMQPAR
ncbi:MAG TPA: aminotransferase class I/II-fold pyridoxal phosphate-dependent enzyme [Terriglobales bacterium]|jgi:histidinol-phosphate aminotransferase|nr:aminotransferase class I/II-fold pyridoxal phosphate-dependent enzyme [Terriglobales bacterium]